jgi:hypothetical protein
MARRPRQVKRLFYVRLHMRSEVEATRLRRRNLPETPVFLRFPT